MTSVGIVNAWGWNRGDEAMLSSLICHLQAKHSDVEITVYSREDLDLARFGVRGEPWLTESPVLTRLVTKAIRRIPGYLDAQARLAQARLRLTLPLWARKTNVLRHDFVISSPAGPYLGDLYPKTEGCCLTPLAICAKRGTPFGILAVSCGPFHKECLNPLRRMVFSRARFWTVREDISREHLERLDLACPKHCGGDLAFAHPDRDPGQFLEEGQRETYQTAENLLRNGAIVLTLSHTAHMAPGAKTQPFDPVGYARKTGRLLKHVLEKTGRQILVFPHFYGSAQEQKNIRGVIGATGSDGRIHVLAPDLNAEAQMRLYSQAAFCISHRYHPTIFALRAGRPCLCMRHQFKAEGMLAMFGDPGAVVRTTDSAEDWIRAFDETWENRDAIARQIQERLPAVRASSLKHLEILDEHLAQCAGTAR